MKLHPYYTQDNFLVNDLDEVELCDFGISRVLNGAQSGFTTGPHAGTFAFEAPEYMLGSNPPTQYTTDLDVYSFGCCILTVGRDSLPNRQEPKGR